MSAEQGGKEAVEAFFSRGKLLTPDALRYLESRNAGDFLEGAYNTLIDIEDLLAREDKIRIITNITKKKTEITTGDMVKFYNSKYDKMKNIILTRLQKNFVSINKLESQKGEVFILGIVREIKENDGIRSAEIEDSTGSVTAVFEKGEQDDLEIDDVAAIQGTPSGKALLAKSVFFPDVPLREPNKSVGKACFISGLNLDEAPKQDLEKFLKWFEGQENIRYLFITGRIGDADALEGMIDTYCRNKKVMICASSGGDLPDLPIDMKTKAAIPLSNPSMIEINGIKILLFDKFQTKMLKKRHLSNIKPFIDEDAMALEELPDIVHCAGDAASVSNYKSVTVINSGSLLTDFRPVIADFSTRECQLLNMEELKLQ